MMYGKSSRKNGVLGITLTVFVLLQFSCVVTPTISYAENDTTIEAPDDTLNQSGEIQEGVDPNSQRDFSGEGASSASDTELSGFNGVLYRMITAFGGVALWFGGMLLDNSLSIAVVNMGGVLRDYKIDEAINAAWQVVRDVFNLLFIFSLLYIGFSIILGNNDAQAKRTLGTLIAAALLINFSLYATKLIVDFSNLAAYETYKLIDVRGTVETTFNLETKGIAGAFTQMTNIDQHQKTAASAIKNMSKNNVFAVIMMSVLMMIFMLVLAFVFIAGAVIMLTRFVALILLMIFSPAMFLGWVFPAFASHSSKWWHTFLNYAFVAPAYIFMLYLSLQILKRLSIDGSVPEAFGQSGTFGFFVFLAIIAGFAWGSLIVARHMGVAGATQAINIGNGVRKSAQSTLGAYSIGLTAAGLGVANDRFRSSRFSQSTTGTALRWTTNALTLGATSDRSIRSIAQAGKEAKYGGSDSFNSLVKEDKNRRVQLSNEQKVNELNAALRRSAKKPDDLELKRSAQRALANASSSQVLSVLSKIGGKNNILDNAGELTADQAKKLLESDEISAKYKDEFAGERGNQIYSKFTEGPVDERRKFASASKSELDAIGLNRLKEAAVALELTSKNMKDLQDTMTETDYTELKKERDRLFVAVANDKRGDLPSGITMDFKDLLKKSPEEISKLPDDAFGDNEFTKSLSQAALVKIAVEKADVQKIIRDVLDSGSPLSESERDKRRQEALKRWFKTAPAGITFGV